MSTNKIFNEDNVLKNEPQLLSLLEYGRKYAWPGTGKKIALSKELIDKWKKILMWAWEYETKNKKSAPLTLGGIPLEKLKESSDIDETFLRAPLRQVLEKYYKVLSNQTKLKLQNVIRYWINKWLRKQEKNTDAESIARSKVKMKPSKLNKNTKKKKLKNIAEEIKPVSKMICTFLEEMESIKRS